MTRDDILIMGFELLVFVARVEAAKEPLVERYFALGMSEESIATHVQQRQRFLQVRVLIVATVLAAASFFARDHVDAPMLKSIATWIFYSALILAAMQFKRASGDERTSFASLRKMFKK